MSEPKSSSDPTPPVPPAPSFTYGAPPVAPEPAAPLPPPQYGERMPGHDGAPAYPAAAPAYAVYGAAPAGPRRRTWDVVLTIVLLVLGVFGAGIGSLYGFIFLFPEFLAVGLEQQGLESTVGDTSGVGVLLLVSHVTLYLVALGLSILLLVKRKIAFYVPLAAGVIAAVIFFVGVAIATSEIPGLVPTTF